MVLTDTQRGVLKAFIPGAILTVAGLAAGIALFPTDMTPESTVAERLAYALKADILVILCLLHAIGRLGGHRFRAPEDIDGAGLTSGTPQARTMQAVLQNTLEQVVLAIFVHLIWVVVMPASWITAVPAAATMFLVGRLLFTRGYAGGGPARAMGFALTCYPSMVMLIIAAVTASLRVLQ
jgi:uncharacterized MAPEG superfamily protein